MTRSEISKLITDFILEEFIVRGARTIDVYTHEGELIFDSASIFREDLVIPLSYLRKAAGEQDG